MSLFVHRTQMKKLFEQILQIKLPGEIRLSASLTPSPSIPFASLRRNSKLWKRSSIVLTANKGIFLSMRVFKRFPACKDNGRIIEHSIHYLLLKPSCPAQWGISIESIQGFPIYKVFQLHSSNKKNKVHLLRFIIQGMGFSGTRNSSQTHMWLLLENPNISYYTDTYSLALLLIKERIISPCTHTHIYMYVCMK